MQQIPSSPLYELWVNMSGITQFVPLCQTAGWKTNSRLFAKQLIIKKWCRCTAADKDSSWFEFSQVEDAEWDRCQWLSARWNLLPNNVWIQCYIKHLPGDSEAKMTDHAQYKSHKSLSWFYGVLCLIIWHCKSFVISVNWSITAGLLNQSTGLCP